MTDGRKAIHRGDFFYLLLPADACLQLGLSIDRVRYAAAGICILFA